ncbi:flagellar basal body-associated protein FliL [Sulfuricurvum sp.]|uniref:flagellar basal body-associated protein FliL n=1 Tax=Sulfuricurvum sp. TaxID=2025608 RepID=UPI002E3461E6|nr:flagellar basal body-associated protein FliL [Sulfuricurvum sp.]HEX5329821.1 flagellar basal body-associated protein FliL [Sulfuricurvum sp.]
MAEKEKEEHEAEEGGKKKSGNMLLIIIIAVLVLILVIGGVVAALMMGNHDAEAEAGKGAKTEVAAEGHATEGEATHDGEAKATEVSNEALTEVGIMFPLEPFTVNLLSESGRRYLKCEMNLEMDGKELSPELEEKKPVFRDIIIRILSSKSLEEISTSKGKEKLKEEIVRDLNTRLKDGKIKNVHFTDFVVQ